MIIYRHHIVCYLIYSQLNTDLPSKFYAFYRKINGPYLKKILLKKQELVSFFFLKTAGSGNFLTLIAKKKKSGF